MAGTSMPSSNPPRAVPGERHYEDYRMKIMSEFINLKPPKFEGLPNPFAAKRWLETIKEMFEAARISPQFQVGYAIYLFEGIAEDWLEMKEDQNCNVASLSWDKFERMFREMFVPDASLKRELLTELCELGQRKMTVAEYFSRFKKLSIYDEAMVADPVLLCDKFKRGLNPEIKSKLAIYNITDIDVLVDAAIHAEGLIFRQRNRENKLPIKKSGKIKADQHKQGVGKKSGKWSKKSNLSGNKRFRPYTCSHCQIEKQRNEK